MKPEEILSILPPRIKDELFNSFNEVLRNYREQRWEPSELNGGKMCEIIYTIIRGYIDGHIPDTSSKPRNFVDACRNLEQATNTFTRSMRIQIPRMLSALYEIRNNRGVGHAGGDINPNHMDAIAVVYMSKWLLAELVRIFHDVEIAVAQQTVEKIIEILSPIIWEVDGNLRILQTNLTMKGSTLLLLYHSQNELDESKLIQYLEHSNPTVYRRDVLRKLHKDRFIEYNEKNKVCRISPKGIEYVEKEILPKSI
jgi:hypothetical protein